VRKSILVRGAELLQMPPPLSLLLAGVMSLLVPSVVMALALLLAEAALLLLLAMALALLALALALLVLALAMVGWSYQWRRGAVAGS